MPAQILGGSNNFSLPVRQEGKREDSQKTSCRKRRGVFAGMFMLVCSCLITLLLVGNINKSEGECTRQYSRKNFPAKQNENLNLVNNAYRPISLNAKCNKIFVYNLHVFNLQTKPNGANKLSRANRIRIALANRAKVRTDLIAQEIM